MPFDSPPLRAEDVTLPDLIAWLETKDPNERYDYTDANNCLWAQYLKAQGAAVFCISSSEMPGDGPNPWGWRVANNGFYETLTFGCALATAKKILAEEFVAAAR